MTIAEKLSQVRCSGKFTAMLGFILGERWTSPVVTEMVITGDGMLLMANEDDPFCDDFVGAASDLWRNLRGVAKVAGLTPDETKTLISMARRKVRHA